MLNWERRVIRLKTYVFFDHYDALCPGGIDIHMAIEEMGLDDIFIDDGTPRERKKAFGPYQFTFLCGNFHENGAYPPQALVDAFVLGALPLVPYELYRDLAKFHFHLPDAAQGVRRLGRSMFYFAEGGTTSKKRNYPNEGNHREDALIAWSGRLPRHTPEAVRRPLEWRESKDGDRQGRFSRGPLVALAPPS